jgi:hypothetical protein
MGMHCLKCGGQLTPDAKEPLCGFCRNDIAKEAINKNPIWAIRIAFEAIADAINDIKTDVNTIKEVQKEIIEAIKLKP